MSLELKTSATGAGMILQRPYTVKQEIELLLYKAATEGRECNYLIISEDYYQSFRIGLIRTARGFVSDDLEVHFYKQLEIVRVTAANTLIVG